MSQLAASSTSPLTLTGWPLFRRVLQHSFSLEHRRTGPPWMYYIVTALFSTAVAVVLTALFVGLS